MPASGLELRCLPINCLGVSRLKWVRILILLGFKDMSTLVGHFVSSPREREKRDKRASIGDEREGQGRQTGMKVKKQKKLEMCQYDTGAPAKGPSSPARRHFSKNEVEKRAITLIIIGRFDPKSNLTYIL